MSLKDNDLLGFVRDNIHSDFALIIGYLTILTYTQVDVFIKELIPSIYWRFVLFIIVNLAWTFFWLFKKYQLPRTKKNMIGLIIALKTENDIQMLRIKNDFTQQLNKNIKENGLDNLIEVLVLDNHQSKIIEDVLLKYS